jgi:cell division protein FtsI/penicillin-binding protein 2
MFTAKQFQNRTILLTFLFTFLFAAIIGKIIHLSICVPERKVYKTKKEVLRGIIYDRRGIELAISREAYDVGIVPSKVKDVKLVAELIEPIIDISRKKIIKKIKKHNRFFFLKRAVPKKTANLLKGLQIQSLQLTRLLSRVYPNQNLAGNLLGFTNIDNIGIEGIEKQYDHILSRPSDDANLRGYNLHLTIDSLVQFKVEQVMQKYLAVSGAKRGVTILMDIKSGGIICMVTTPSYDPNHFQKYSAAQLANLAIRHNYEPGSTLKIFIAAALLSEDSISPDEIFKCEGKIELTDTIINCTRKHGNLTISQILKHSCNAGIIQAAQKISPELLYRYFLNFGFGEKTGIGLIGETSGNLKPVQKWDYASRYFLPIGQGLMLTPIQLLQAVSVFGAQGNLLKPQIKSHYTNSFGETTSVFKPQIIRKVIDSSVAATILHYMEDVVADGTGNLARAPGIRIAGKTGTGQIAGNKGYIPDAYTASFVGVFPVQAPRIAGIVLFDRPVEPHSGGGLAAPAFSEIVQTILPLLREHQSIPFEKIKPLALEISKLKKNVLPNFIGKSIKEVVFMVDYLGIEYEIKGTGYVVHQSPSPGTPIQKVPILKLVLNLPK